MTETKHVTFDELVKMLPTPGWELGTGNETFPVEDHTLEELVRVTHARHARKEAPGIIKRIENELELDAIELQKLWIYLGLPF